MVNEISLLADQMLEFVPWVAQLARAKACQDERLLYSPPEACHFWIHPNLLCDYTWTVRAWESHEQHRQEMERREEHLQRRRRQRVLRQRVVQE